MDNTPINPHSIEERGALRINNYADEIASLYVSMAPTFSRGQSLQPTWSAIFPPCRPLVDAAIRAVFFGYRFVCGLTRKTNSKKLGGGITRAWDSPKGAGVVAHDLAIPGAHAQVDAPPPLVRMPVTPIMTSRRSSPR
ncbi:hypothetical protein [Methylocapsa aurea]|uniref:hypothetical protein n=1 Tax=Methylocapsa aurea TaxID=663610 RepID=UPI00056133E4|nr:hypothetical protein [Methylocapsa aurea]